jgi:hypothetical protein
MRRFNPHLLEIADSSLFHAMGTLKLARKWKVPELKLIAFRIIRASKTIAKQQRKLRNKLD